MKVAVWDTYVKKQDGSVMHFDIFAPKELTDRKTIFGFGKSFLKTRGEPSGKIDVEECQFCHVEEPTPEMVRDINKQGYHILEMDDIPAGLPENPSRRDLILYLRGHYAQYRFADFGGKQLEDLQEIVSRLA